MHPLTFPTSLKILSLSLLVFCAFPGFAADFHEYPCEPDLIEIMFILESMVRLMGPFPEDLSGLNATDGVEHTLMMHGGGHTLASGVYFARLVAEGKTQTSKLVMSK